MSDLSQISLINPLRPNSIVESTLLEVELVCCLQHSVTIFVEKSLWELWYINLRSLSMSDLSQVSLKNPLGPNSIVESTLLGVELVCCLQHSVTM